MQLWSGYSVPNNYLQREKPSLVEFQLGDSWTGLKLGLKSNIEQVAFTGGSLMAFSVHLWGSRFRSVLLVSWDKPWRICGTKRSSGAICVLLLILILAYHDLLVDGKTRGGISVEIFNARQ
ncbi:hypothetical protein F4604DRAFT_1261389 [Suillus subluteus]|nr:hypothetical protein F4604DRAFT_1261389 [Suillus subluteus]